MTYIPNQRPGAPWSQHTWQGQFDLATQLPNMAGSATQINADLQLGDLAWAADTNALYMCTLATPGAATWAELQKSGAPGTVVGPSNAIYVDVAGFDAGPLIGLRGNAARPFASVQAALNAQLTDSDEVLIGPGGFAIPVTLKLLATVKGVTIRGSGQQTTFLVGAAGVDILSLSSNPGVTQASIFDLTMLSDGAGKCIVGNGSADAGGFLSTGLLVQDVALSVVVPGAVLAIDLTYANKVNLVDVAIFGGTSFVTCGSVVWLSTLQSVGNLLTTWDDLDPAKPLSGRLGTQLLGGSICPGEVAMGGQAAFLTDDGSRIGSLTGLFLSFVGALHPAIDVHGAIGVADFSSVAPDKLLPSTATGPSFVSFAGARFTSGGASFTLIAGPFRQSIDFTGVVTTKPGFTLVADSLCDIVASGASFHAPVGYVTSDSQAIGGGTLLPPHLSIQNVDISAGGATVVGFGFDTGNALYSAPISSQLQGADAVVAAPKLGTGFTITSTAVPLNTADVTVTWAT